MIKRLVLFGASNFGDEVVQLFRDVNQTSEAPQWEIVGFIDDNVELTGVVRDDIPVLGTRQWLDENDLGDLQFIVSIGNPRAKAKVVEMLRSKGARFATGIHPSVILSNTVAIGEGSIVAAGTILTTNITVGRHTIFGIRCAVGHNTVIGDYATVNPGAIISGDITIEDGVLIGAGACVLERLTVGAYSIIGASAVVTRDVPARVTSFGNPARVKKEHAD